MNQRKSSIGGMNSARQAEMTQVGNSQMGHQRLDAFDRKILKILATDARTSNVEIARAVGLTEAPCSRRIKRLEEDGIIEGYTARIRPDAVNASLSVIVTLVFDEFTAIGAQDFADAVQALPQVVFAYIVSGRFDVILHVMVPDAEGYSHFVLHQLRQIPGIKDVRSSFVMRRLKDSPTPPLILSK
jgi:Lrp/AsnC family leucine-responsive transcriptional regulator